MDIVTKDILKLLLSIVLGGFIGAEREYQDKTAGFRTIIFICVGATLFTIFSTEIGGDNDPRIAAAIVSGVGFLGAGVILRGSGRIVGLTTASMIWLSAAIGMGVGAGRYYFAIITTAVILLILWFFPGFEDWIDKRRETRIYDVISNLPYDKLGKIEEFFKSSELKVRRSKQTKSKEGEMVCTFFTYGKPQEHERVIQKLMTDQDVKSFIF